MAEPTVLIAKVDATADNAKSTAEKQGVTSYPTIKYFPKGSAIAEDYEGGRSEQDFIDFLNQKTSTQRVVGGGLNANAGTIASLDALVSQFIGGGSLSTISEEVITAARGLHDKYAGYYVKVFGKLSISPIYPGKELARIEGLIKKGGLAPAKLDDLVSRSNILRKFSKSGIVKEEL